MEENHLMESKPFSFNLQRVHQLNLKITCFLVVLVTIPLIVDNGFAESKPYIITGVIVITMACLNYVMKIPSMVKALYLQH